MKITLAKKAGHCFGVKAAIKKAFEIVKTTKRSIFTLGPIIHNPQVVEMLEKRGVVSVNSLSQIDKGVIIVRSHGVPPQLIDEARARGLRVVDATCPFVKRAQNLARELVEQKYELVILGDAAHPEVGGIVGTVNGAAHVVSDADDVKKLPDKKRYGLIVQTTQSLENLQQVTSALLTKTVVLKVINTICNATTELQKETRRLAGQVDAMLVVGGRNSANTSRLAVISREAGVPTYHIETADEIDNALLQGVLHVGVTAGTSTPDWIINQVMERLRLINNTTKESAGEHGGINDGGRKTKPRNGRGGKAGIPGGQGNRGRHSSARQ
ncbi:4-hydroxy-3-methylbut-2-enyl diphosphate reductase [candidate division FCPU426 bacterium]|nr:4-hydroxy-3-methylbut-2-enyl diphosphate reductase [candidate division FCPU426 bacterium]